MSRNRVIVLSLVVIVALLVISNLRPDEGRELKGNSQQGSDLPVRLKESTAVRAATKSQNVKRTRTTDDWEESEILSQFSKLSLGLQRGEVEQILGAPISMDEHFGLASVTYFKLPEDFRNWLSLDGSDKESKQYGISVSYLDGEVFDFFLNPQFVHSPEKFAHSHERLDRFLSEFPTEPWGERIQRTEPFSNVAMDRSSQADLKAAQLERAKKAEQDAAQ